MLFATFALKFPAPHGKFDFVRTIISIGVDGAPIVGWEPDLNEGGTKQERVYTVEGRESLTDGSWWSTVADSAFLHYAKLYGTILHDDLRCADTGKMSPQGEMKMAQHELRDGKGK